MKLLPRLIITLLICLIAIPVLAIPVTPSSAQDIPLLPHAFYGNVTINGTPAANDTVVEARGEGVSTGIQHNPITVTEAGKYGASGGLDPKLVVQGNITDGTNLTFYVNNVTAQCYDVQAGGQWLDSYPFKSGEVTVLNLRVAGEAPPSRPDISVSPTEKNFGNVTMNSSSSPQTFNVSNVGNADLTVGTINITGTNADQFTIHNDDVSNQTIIPGSSATLQVVFTPTSTGAKSATLNIPSNDPAEATALVSLSGTGVTEGPGPGPGVYYLTVNMLGDISNWEISEQGNLLGLLQVSSADNKVAITLAKDASCHDKETNKLSTITISEQTNWPPVPEDYDIIGAAYEFQPAGAEFAPSLSLTLRYVDNDVPQYASEEDVYIAYYDAPAGNWVPLSSQVDTQNNRVAAPVSHFTTFAIMGAAVPPTPANFAVTTIDLSSEQVEPGQEVFVIVNVTNTGDSEGSYTLNLTINGEVEQTKTVTLAPSASDTVTFTVTKEKPGTYTVSVDGATKEFIVEVLPLSWVSQYWWIVLTTIIIIGIMVSFLWRRRRVSA
jgi:uncharacterized cupredoxin-like copper-binding protein